MADGRLSAKDDDIRDAFDRTNKYDHAGRLSFNQFGIDIVTSKRVYEQTASYDGFSNLTARATTYWDEQNDMDVEFTNGRITSDNTVVYDAAGNIVSKGTGATLRTDVFDASGRRTSSKDRWASSGGQGATVNERQTDHISDADGRPIIEKLGARQYSPNPGTLTMAVYKYQVWSTVLGKAVATMDPSGNQIENRVYAGGVLLAISLGRSTTGTSSDDSISFFASDPVTDSKVTYFYNNSTSNFVNEEKEPFGQNVSSTDPYIEEWNTYGQVLNGAQDPQWQCTLYNKMYGEDSLTPMPTHCAKVAMQADWIMKYVEFPRGAEDLTNIATADAHKGSHGSRAGASPSDAVIAETTTSTQKSDKGGPNVSDDPDTPNCGTQDCVVMVNGLDVPEFVDASIAYSEEGSVGYSVCSLAGLNIPDGVDFKNNIVEAEKHRLTGPTISGALFPVKGAADAVGDYNNATWFQEKVRNAHGRTDDVKNGVSWDYKQLGKQYENFGNWNYGLTGAAVGFSERLLLRKAGEANLAAMNSDQRSIHEEKWGTPGNILTDPNGGTKSFGDDPTDQYWISRGYQYYAQKCGGRK